MDYRKSADEIQNEMLDQVDDQYEKTKGYFLWDILKAFAIQMKQTLSSIQQVANSLDVENLTGQQLEKFIYQRTGIERKKATFAQGVLSVIGNGTIRVGDFFETEGFIRFMATQTVDIIERGSVHIQAIEPGISGNVPAGTVTKIPVTIQGISKCMNEKAISDGYEAESDIDLLNRYYDRLRAPATSGNIFHYKQWAKEVPGVGDAKVFSLWNGNNTVKVIIINQDRKPASMQLVKEVQNYIDPGIVGLGVGQAPIGAFCTVASAEAKEINISVKITANAGFSLDLIKSNIEKEIERRLFDIAFLKDYLSYAVIGSTILGVDGVLDYENLTINGEAKNIECGKMEVMILGGVTLI